MIIKIYSQCHMNLYIYYEEFEIYFKIYFEIKTFLLILQYLTGFDQIITTMNNKRMFKIDS